MATSSTATGPADLVIAGAGIVGLSLALDGVLRGLRVTVVEQGDRPTGASVRNFGHGCVTAQSGLAQQYARTAHRRWLMLRDAAGLAVQECGTVVAARSGQEMAVLTEFTDRNRDDSAMLTAAQVQEQVPLNPVGLLGGALLDGDLRVDPRTAVPLLARYLADRGVQFQLATTVHGAETGVLHTSRGAVPGGAVVLALGHDLDRVLPAVAEGAGLTRCTLHMLRVAAPGGATFTPAVLTGTSLLRYSGFTACPASAALARHMQAEHPALIDAGVNLMFTQLPDGDLIIGDTHSYAHSPSPFAAEDLDLLLLEQTELLLGAGPLTVRERWRGTYAWAPEREYLSHTPAPGVRAVAVTSGIGMTTALGFAPAVLDDLLGTV